MRVLVTGAGGMLGYAVPPVLEANHQVIALTRKDCDLCDEDTVREIFLHHRPDAVVHLAAFTNVDGCELEPEKAKAGNETTTLNVAKSAKSVGAALVYISTDYVFDGQSRRPYREVDRPNPISVYGLTKLAGEKIVQETLDRYFIVRTSWLFGPNGKNFVSTILQLASEKPEIKVVNDQQGSPTYTSHLAQKLAELITTSEYGIYHITGSGSCTWYEFAKTIVDSTGFSGLKVMPVTTQEFERPAPRPAYSVLANQHLASLGMFPLPHWKDGLESYLGEIRNEAVNASTKIQKRPAFINDL